MSWTDTNRPEGQSGKNAVYYSLFGKFTNSSTIHGTYFLGESTTLIGRTFWVIVVAAGISASGWIINNSFKAWESNPVITSVQWRKI
jgi:hypothetical protein